jgi:hypothetical protein
MAMTITHGENEIISISPPSGIDAQILEVSEHPGGSSSRGESQALPGQSEPLGQLGFEDHTKVLQAQGPLAIGQPVFHPFVGYGTIAGVDGDEVTLQGKKDKAVTHVVKALDLITKSQAEVGFEACYFVGGAKAWRRAMGKWASLYKNLCLMEGKGTYGDWLKRHDLSRSSMDDLIRQFENEATWDAQEQLLPESGKTDETNAAPTLEIGMSPYAVTAGRQDNERTTDLENDERQKNIQAETAKREGITPTKHKTILYLQRRKSDPEKLVLYYAIREIAKSRVDTIMQRKIDEGIEEVLALAPALLPTQPEPTPDLSEEMESATSIIAEDSPTKGTT